MAGKRRADKELTSDNWDEEDEPEEPGTFQKASENILKNRVIKTAKRRITNGAADSEHKSIFSHFTAFATKTENKSPFSFVSNLKEANTVDKVDSSKKPAFSFSAGSNFNLKAKEAIRSSSSLSLNTSSIPIESSKLTQLSFPMKCDVNANRPDIAKKSEVSKIIDNQSKLSTLSNKLKTVSEEQIVQNADSKSDKAVKTPDEIFLQKLRSLNLLCTEWIIKHLNENLSYILTPIFDDYKKYLTQLREERQNANSTCKKAKVNELTEAEVPNSETTKSESVFKANLKENSMKINFGSTNLFSDNKEKEDTPPAMFKFTSAMNEEKPSFTFSNLEKKDNALKSAGTADTIIGSGLFKFSSTSTNESAPVNDKPEPAPSSYFSLKPNSTPSTNLFFSQNTATKSEENTNTEDDAPPPIEDVTIKEEGSVYDKKCKVFIKKDGNFVDHGVGFLFLKLVSDEKKCQVIVRANNKLANVIINVLLTSSIPVQKMGKNNVMIICCPTPESKQPTSVLLKVKTSDDADELLNNLNKYRK